MAMAHDGLLERGAARSAAFVTVACGLCAGLAGCTLQTPLYPIYQAAWQLSPAGITLVYVCYMVGVLCSLLFFGRLSDQFGRGRVLKAALVLLAIALLASAAAPGIGWLMLARAGIGVASGLLTSTSAAALVDLHPRGNQKVASLTASAVSVAGLGLGPLLGGLVAQFAPWPLVSPYLLIVLLLVPILVAMARLLPVTTPVDVRRLTLRPSFRLPARGRRGAFLSAGLAGFCGFGVISLLASLAPSFLREVMGWHGPAAAGLAVGMMFCISGAMQIASRGMEPRRGLMVGLGVMIAGLALQALSISEQSGPIFIASEGLSGAGQGLSFMAGMVLVNRIIDPAHRGASLAAFLVVVYLGGMLPVLMVGFLASRFGLPAAIEMFCAGIGLLSAIMIPVSSRTARRLPALS
jgi:MFS family permease